MGNRPARLAPDVMRREASHRRLILLGLAALLVLSMSPVFGHHALHGIDHALVGRDHLWALCMVALHAVLAPVHGLFHLLFIGGITFAVVDRVRAQRKGGQVLRALAVTPPVPGDAIERAAQRAGVAIDRVRVVDGLPTPAFTAGWFTPRIYLAAALPERLSDDELAAVIAHEAAHMRAFDPLRLSALRFLASLLFWLPALRHVAADYAAEREVHADDTAAERHGLALASALVRLASWDTARQPALGVRFTDGDLLERRVLRLTGERIPPRSRVTRRSLAAAAAALLLAWSSGIAVAHPLPDEHDAHCEHAGAAAILHLFCTAGYPFDRASDCPHRAASV